MPRQSASDSVKHVPHALYAFGQGIHRRCSRAAKARHLHVAIAVAVGAWLDAATDGTILPLARAGGVMAVAAAPRVGAPEPWQEESQ
jgi:hypothetical protein